MLPDPFLPRVAVRVGKGSGYARLDTYRGNTIENRGCLYIYWRASEASETWIMQNRVYVIYIYVCMYGWYVCSLNARAGNFFLLKTRLFRLDSSLF